MWLHCFSFSSKCQYITLLQWSLYLTVHHPYTQRSYMPCSWILSYFAVHHLCMHDAHTYHHLLVVWGSLRLTTIKHEEVVIGTSISKSHISESPPHDSFVPCIHIDSVIKDEERLQHSYRRQFYGQQRDRKETLLKLYSGASSGHSMWWVCSNDRVLYAPVETSSVENLQLICTAFVKAIFSVSIIRVFQ